MIRHIIPIFCEDRECYSLSSEDRLVFFLGCPTGPEGDSTLAAALADDGQRLEVPADAKHLLPGKRRFSVVRKACKGSADEASDAQTLFKLANSLYFNW